MDLEKIQAQLKSHIRQHQILVEEMKRDPHNVEIQQKVQHLQVELTQLSEKQRQVVQQLKQNIQPRSENFARDFSQNHQKTSQNSLTSAGSPGFPLHHSPFAISQQFGRNAQLKSRVSPPPSTKFIPKMTQNNVIHLQNISERKMTRKPDMMTRKPNMVTTGMQTAPSVKSERFVLPWPEAKKAKVEISTNRSEQQTAKQNTEKHERRRRTSAIFSPYSSFQFFDEPKRPSTGIKRGRGRPAAKNGDNGLKSPVCSSPVFVPINGFKPSSDEHRSDRQITRSSSSCTSPKDGEHEDHCAVCQQSGEVLMCDTCVLVYHLKCLSPPLTRIPTGMWMCPKCQESIQDKEPMEWPGTLAVAHSYLKHRAEKDKEKQTLLSRNQELKLQELELQRKVNELSSAIVTQIQKKTEIVESTRETQEKLQKLKRFLQIVHSS